MRERAEGIWLSQKTRWTQDKVLTAGPIFRLPGATARGRYRLGNGYARNTLGDDGKYYPGWRR